MGLTSASYHSAAAFSSSFKMAMIGCAALLAAGSVLSALTIDNNVLRSAPQPPVPAGQEQDEPRGQPAAARTRRIAAD